MVTDKKPEAGSNLHRRFIFGVLAPPFVTLLILAVIGLWQLDKLLRNQALGELKRSSATIAAKLEREFSLRQTVLKRTGEELFVIKSEYLASRQKLDQNREACRAYVRQKFSFSGSPGGVCEPFLGGLARSGASLATIEDEYIRVGEQLIKDQDQAINARLSAFKQFFPETLALVIVDQNKQIISSALSGAFQGSTEAFRAPAEAALANPIQGQLMTAQEFELAVFAFPITGGSVLAAYDINNDNFIKQTWQEAPIDRERALAIILDSQGSPAYPDLKTSASFTTNNAALRQQPSTEIKLGDVDHTAVGTTAGASNWLAVVASPTALVLAPARDAQLAGLIGIGLLLVGFLWVGTFFIQRLLSNIVSLVSGAMVFGSGRLDYKISLNHAGAEFNRLADTMNAMAQRLATAEKAIDEKNKEFISVATHEIRAPLTAIIGHLSLMKEMHGKKLDSKANLLLDQAYYGTARLRDLVNDMLNAARLESGRSESALMPVDIKAVVDEIVDNMGIVAKIAQVNLSYKDKGAAAVVADENRLRIIINNFVSNAIKYNRPGGAVTVSHDLKGDQLVTVVADDGLGIPEDQKAHMFEKFFRVQHDDRKSVTGTGLGLYIAKQYVEQMHGQLWFESTHGKGTKFFFSLPLVKVRARTRLKKLVQRKLSHHSKQK